MLDFKRDIKKLVMEISDNWTSHIIKVGPGFAIHDTHFLSLLKSIIA